jgi:hypothetical protein
MPDRTIRHLEALGADRFPHVSGSLAQHLRETEALLRRWGDRDALCRAGLYHAVYGTAGIRGSLVGLESRREIRELIGVEAESIAYLYGACDRSTFHPRIGTPAQLLFADRYTASQYPIGEAQLRDFCELTLANELELASSSAVFLARNRAGLRELFERMRGLVSDAGFESYRTMLA